MRVTFENVTIPDVTVEQIDSWLRARVPDMQGWSYNVGKVLVIDFGENYEETIKTKIANAEAQFGVAMQGLDVLGIMIPRENVIQ